MPPHNKEVLIIDDDTVLSDMYGKCLELSDFRVTVADSGEDGQEKAKENPVDLILLDIIMPGQDGFATLKNLKTFPETKNIPVIMLTNLGQESDIQKGKKLGAVDYLVKSQTNPGQVAKKVTKLLA